MELIENDTMKNRNSFKLLKTMELELSQLSSEMHKNQVDQSRNELLTYLIEVKE